MPRDVDSAAPYATSYNQQHDEGALLVIKTEHDGEGAATSQEPVSWEYFGTDVGSFIKEEKDCIVKTEDGLSELSIKLELDIGPTVLQPQSAPCLPLPLTQVELDVCPGTSSVGGTLPANFWTVFAQPEPRIKEEDDHCPEDSGILCDAGLELGVRKDNTYQKAWIDRAHDDISSERITMGIREGDHYTCSVTSQIKYERGTDVSGAKADAHPTGKQYECEHCKYFTTKKSSLIKHMKSPTDSKPYNYDQYKHGASRLPLLKEHLLNSQDKKSCKPNESEY